MSKEKNKWETKDGKSWEDCEEFYFVETGPSVTCSYELRRIPKDKVFLIEQTGRIALKSGGYIQFLEPTVALSTLYADPAKAHEKILLFLEDVKESTSQQLSKSIKEINKVRKYMEGSITPEATDAESCIIEIEDGGR